MDNPIQPRVRVRIVDGEYRATQGVLHAIGKNVSDAVSRLQAERQHQVTRQRYEEHLNRAKLIALERA